MSWIQFIHSGHIMHAIWATIRFRNSAKCFYELYILVLKIFETRGYMVYWVLTNHICIIRISISLPHKYVSVWQCWHSSGTYDYLKCLASPGLVVICVRGSSFPRQLWICQVLDIDNNITILSGFLDSNIWPTFQDNMIVFVICRMFIQN